MGQRGRCALPLCRASCWILRICSTACSRVAAMAWCMLSRVAPLDEQRGIAVADEQRLQLLATDAGQERGVVDLVAVEVQDRQHRPVADRVEELVAVPARGERAGFGLAVPDHGQSDQVRVVEDRPVGVRDAVAQLAALVDAAGGFGGAVAADAAGERELLEEALQSRQVFTLVRVDLGIRPFEVGLGQDRRAHRARARRCRSRPGRTS